MVKIRLRRKGKKHYPVYDIVVVDARVKRDGKYLERLGYFDPNTQPSTIQINSERAIFWLNQGAQPTDTVRNLLSYEGVLLARHLQFKGKTPEEIEEIVRKHKEIVLARYFRRKELRKKREEAKKKAKEQAEQVAQEQ
ncbi:30S ribosomal protein S16 [Bacteroidetes/Chlorobi group bacterium Naka2016]|jgi:small subunit ribosomal protein S16|nr:MAG: 30S ribosomal protein S16 [Bacteroidetes/Chlorobi group bacterium Naka2016]